jgi:putative transposase
MNNQIRLRVCRDTADQPNPLWGADATYLPTWAGFIYLAIVLDGGSRRIVGGAIRESLEIE